MERPVPGELRPEIENPQSASFLESAGILALEVPFAFKNRINQWKNSSDLGRNVSIGIILASLGLGLTALGSEVVSRYEKSKPVAVEVTVRPQEQRYVLPHTIIKAMEYEVIVLRGGTGVSFPKGMLINASNDIELTFYPNRLYNLMTNPLSGIDMEPESADIFCLTTLENPDPLWEEFLREFNNNQYRYMQEVYKHNQNVSPTYWSSRIQTVGNFIFMSDAENLVQRNLGNALSVEILRNIKSNAWFASGNRDAFQDLSAEFAQAIKDQRPIQITDINPGYLQRLRSQLILKPS